MSLHSKKKEERTHLLARGLRSLIESIIREVNTSKKNIPDATNNEQRRESEDA